MSEAAELLGLTEAERDSWQEAAVALDKRLTETIEALVDAAMSDFGAIAGVQWEHWRALTGYRLPEWREVCALREKAV